MAELDPGVSGYVARILDDDPQLLRWFDDNGVTLDIEMTVQERKPFGGALEVSLGSTPGPRTLDLGVQAVTSLWLSNDPPLTGVMEPHTCHYASCRHTVPRTAGR